MSNNLKINTNILVALVLSILIAYAAIVYQANNNPAWFNNPVIASIVKEPILKVVSGELSFSVQGDVQQLTFHFNKPIAEADKILVSDQSGKQKLTYILENSEDNYWLYIKKGNEEQETLDNLPISFEISSDKISNRQPAFIDEIHINKRKVSATVFFKNHIRIDRFNKNIILYYPLALKNISNTLANYIGDIFVSIILVTLLLITATQFVIFLFSVIFSKFIQPPKNDILHIIDYLTESYAIPLGLLGTIISIWYSLEVANQNISNYGELIEIIKIAIFTSVLGVSSFMLHETRKKIYKLISN